MKAIKRLTSVWVVAVLVSAAPTLLWAQQRGGAPTMSAQAEEPFDPTGYWVSIISDDWVFRMVVLQRGQYSDVPITLKAKEFADAWQPGADEAAGKQCEAYGAAVIMQVPEQLHITWQDANTLKVQTDAGLQTRLLQFHPNPAVANVPPSRQGYSAAQWMLYRTQMRRPNIRVIAPGQSGNTGDAAAAPSTPRPQYGWLQVLTTDMLPGLLRKNGVPYSAQTRMTEDWALNIDQDGVQWLTVTTTLNDPVYLSGPYERNAIFNREADGSKWDPTPCTLRN